MKLKVYIFKKKQIMTAMVIALCLLLSLIIIFAFRSKETIKNVNPVQTVYADIDGDKKLDTLYISTDANNKYNVDIKTKKGDGFTLKPDPLFQTLGHNSQDWPMYIDCKDLNNDLSQEIIIQSSDNEGPIIHIYTYNKDTNEISPIIAGRYDVFGSTTYNNNPILILGKKEANNINFSYYSFNTKIEKISPSKYINFGKDTLNQFTSFISEDNIETISIDSKLTSSLNKGDFLDASLVNVKYKNDIPYTCTYQVRTFNKETNKTNLYKLTMNSTYYKNDTINYDIQNIKLLDLK